MFSTRAKRLRLLALATLILGAPALAQEPLRVLATVGMLGDVAGEVGGDCVLVTTLMGPGVDPHLYRASAGDVRAFEQAELILYVGHGLEGQLGEVLAEFGRSRPTVAVGEAALAPEEAIDSGAYGVDPHIWMDVSLWARVPALIAREVAALRPDCAEPARGRAAAYEAQLRALDAWVRESAATIPEGHRALVTAHDAFAYFGRAYGLEVIGIQGISTESEAGLADIRAVADAVADRALPAIFVESSINPRTIHAVQAAVRDRGLEVGVGATLYSDALGQAGTAAGTYIGMIIHNTRSIVAALGGTPAPLPPALAPWAERWEAGGESDGGAPQAP